MGASFRDCPGYDDGSVFRFHTISIPILVGVKQTFQVHKHEDQMISMN